jgi:hypothetical protein
MLYGARGALAFTMLTRASKRESVLAQNYVKTNVYAGLKPHNGKDKRVYRKVLCPRKDKRYPWFSPQI